MSEPTYVSINKQMLSVINFNFDVLDIPKRPLGIQEQDEFSLSMHQLREEIEEIQDAYSQGDFIGVLDGLIDLEYFLLGIFYKNGVNEPTHSELFDAVHQANILKKQGIKAGREGYSSADAIKPKAWVDPEIMFARILEKVAKRGS